jgi:hypothetical protein
MPISREEYIFENNFMTATGETSYNTLLGISRRTTYASLRAKTRTGRTARWEAPTPQADHLIRQSHY